MAQRALREYDGKSMLSRLIPDQVRNILSGSKTDDVASGSSGQVNLPSGLVQPMKLLPVSLPGAGAQSINWEELAARAPWVLTNKLVVKPDQLIKRRGKSGLIGLNLDWDGVQNWILERMDKPVVVDGVEGVLTHFLVEPFLPHEAKDEYYVAIISNREGDEVLFYHEGGVDVGDVDAKAERYLVPVGDSLTPEEVEKHLLKNVPVAFHPELALYIASLHKVYTEAHFCYLEINPLVVQAQGDASVKVTALDLAAKVDEAAAFLAEDLWKENGAPFPPPFGRKLEKEEAYIHDLDGKTGASLKLTILNRNGRVWTMVAGGGASVVYADTVVDMGAGAELANYGEYSGAPTEAQSYEYAKTILTAMGEAPIRPEGKILLIGGGIANFTDVAKTFTGIIKVGSIFPCGCLPFVYSP